MANKTVVTIEDVGGSFARFVKTAPKEVREALKDVVKKTCFSMEGRMAVMAPVGPDEPHIKDHITHTTRGLTGQVGFIDATQQAGPGNTATLADVALYNEYNPNQQPFMRPAAEHESSDFVRRSKSALNQVERDLSGGGGLL